MTRTPQSFAWIALASGLLTPAVHGALRSPYTADASTPHLYHFSEAAGGSATANAGSAGSNAFTLDANPVAGAPVTSVLGAGGFAGFGNSADFGNNADYLAGFDGNGSGAYQTDQTSAILSPDAVAMSTLGINAANPFTLEAMVKFSVNPTGAAHEFLCTDSSATARGFQFRITNVAPTGGPAGKYLEFNLIGVAGCQRKALIPTLAIDPINGYAAETWFHVAFVYTGTTCQFYWTKVDPSITAAKALTPVDGTNAAAPAMTITAAAATITGPLVIGNEQRAMAAEGLRGSIDEVRISTVARGPGDFLYYLLDTDSDLLDDTWELSFAATLGELSGLGGADGDLDGFSDLDEYTARTNPKNNLSNPNDRDGDGLLDSWENTHFGNTTSQSGSMDADGDYATNAQEFAASTLPTDRTSFPDTEGGSGDGMSDAWEITYFGNLAALPLADADGDTFTNTDEFFGNSNPTDINWTPVKAKLSHRWSFNGSLTDSIGSSTVQIIDPDNDDLTGGGSTLSATDLLLGGGTRATSAYAQLGTNLLQGKKTPVTIELWATQVAVQNWGRIFDFGSSPSEYLMMSWTQAATLATDNVDWTDLAINTSQNTNQPYTLGSEFHIVMTIEPGAGTNSTTLVTWYSVPVGTSDLGSPQGSFSTANQTAFLNDSLAILGRSQFATDSTANARYNEVRIWDGALSFDEREFYHDAGPNVLTVTDADGDGLLDEWEVENFRASPGESVATILVKYDGDDDPDGDLYDNTSEFNNGTDPNDILSSFDGDGDGLPDGWEVLWFRDAPEEELFDITVKFSGTDDPDLDGFSNEAEQTANTNPENGALTPIDSDGDTLVDSWEQFYFSDLDEVASGDPDLDSGTNLQEQNAGSNPTLASSTITDADGDSIADTGEAFQPYTVDSNTLHLWHLDEVKAPAADAVGGGTPLTSLSNGALMWTPSLAGFGTGLNPSAGRGTTASGVLSALPHRNDTSDDVTMAYAGADGAFTFEAIVRIEFNPATAQPLAAPMQIVTGENDVDPTRVWQFRLLPAGGAGNAAGTAPLLEFVNVNGGAAQPLSTALPIAGVNAIAQGNWYHVAVAYNGNEATADNLKLYWTKLDPANAQASQLASLQMTNDLLAGAAIDFSIGNEGRDPGGITDAFLGVVDEVRISSVARNANQFLFVGGGDGDALDDAWEMLYFGGLGETDGGDFDHDGTDNLTEYRLGLIPNKGSSLFVATRGASGLIQWPSVTGVNFTVSRSVDLSVGSWSNIATVPGTAGTASFTDPSPPAGTKAFYRITLNN
ncbi:LamG-like jellyroll fold domain-containing protein [Luteolibacter sp. Populi]|uniref:LamG-like jellyroll fold domain-containing protein n=1 Tax=Luteolibacter sp. Populi TaxID=3230487 RepID=UPI00346523B4